MPCTPFYIIDHDMTLVDTLGVFYRTYRNACIAHGARPPRLGDFVKGFCNDSLREPPGVDPHSFWSYFKYNYSARGKVEIKVMKGAKRFLEELRRRGRRVIVASGRGFPDVIRRELEAVGLMEFVDSVYTIGGDDFDKTILFKKLKQKWRDPCIAIGDYKMDFVSAVQAGCLAIGLTSGCKNAASHKKAGAWLVVDNLDDLVEYIGYIEEGACQGAKM